MKGLEIIQAEFSWVPVICRKAGISQATYFKWKRANTWVAAELRWLKQLEDEDAKLRRVVADVSANEDGEG